MLNDVIVEIFSDEVRTKSGVSARTNSPYTIREQDGFISLPSEPYPQRCVLTLDDDSQPYQPGSYCLDPASFFVGRFNQLMLRVRLDRSSREPLDDERLRAVGS